MPRQKKGDDCAHAHAFSDRRLALRRRIDSTTRSYRGDCGPTGGRQLSRTHGSDPCAERRRANQRRGLCGVRAKSTPGVCYRGSWGAPGNFRFAQNLEDAEPTLAFIRSPDNAKRLSTDVNRIVICGHSMRGWVAAETLAHEPNLLGAVIISACDFGALGRLSHRNSFTATGSELFLVRHSGTSRD